MYQEPKNFSYFDMKYVYKPCQSLEPSQYSWIPASCGLSESTANPFDSDPLGSNPIAEIMGDKKDLIRSKIEMLVAGITERKRIKQDNIYRIDLDSCELNNIIFQMPYYRRYFFGRERLMVEKMKMDLESQKRMEEVNYFRDLSLLHKDLKDSIIEYISEQKKQKLLSNLEE